MRSRFEVFSVLLLLSPPCFSISCITCRNEECSEQKIVLGTCNRNTPILPFQTSSHKTKEHLKYGCLELKYINGNSITSLKQCVQTENLGNFCTLIPKSIHVIQCIVKAPTKNNLFKILQNNAEQNDSDKPTDSFAIDRDKKTFNLIAAPTLNPPSVKTASSSSSSTNLKTKNQFQTSSLTEVYPKFSSTNKKFSSVPSTSVMPEILNFEDKKNENPYATYSFIEFEPNTSTSSPFTTAPSDDYYSTTTPTTEENESTDGNTGPTSLSAGTISETFYTHSYLIGPETTLSSTNTASTTKFTDPTIINLDDNSNEDLLTTTSGLELVDATSPSTDHNKVISTSTESSPLTKITEHGLAALTEVSPDFSSTIKKFSSVPSTSVIPEIVNFDGMTNENTYETYSSIKFEPNTSTFSPFTTISSDDYYLTTTTTTTEEKESTDGNTDTTSLPARTITETFYTHSSLIDPETTLSYTNTPTTTESTEDLLTTTSGLELVDATSPSTDYNEVLNTSTEGYPVTENTENPFVVSAKPVSLNTKSPSIEEFNSSTEQSYSTIINKSNNAKDDLLTTTINSDLSRTEKHTTEDSFDGNGKTESSDSTLGTSKLPKTVNCALRLKLSFSIFILFICVTCFFWFE